MQPSSRPARGLRADTRKTLVLACIRCKVSWRADAEASGTGSGVRSAELRGLWRARSRGLPERGLRTDGHASGRPTHCQLPGQKWLPRQDVGGRQPVSAVFLVPPRSCRRLPSGRR